MSCCSLPLPKYLCQLPTIPVQLQNVFNCLSNNVVFLTDTCKLSSYFKPSNSFPYRITIVDTNGRVIYDNVTPSRYWCLMNNSLNNLEFQIATLGSCRAVVRTEYPFCPYGPNGPGCYPIPNFTAGYTGCIPFGFTGCGGHTGCSDCKACIDNNGSENNYTVPSTCMYFGATGCTGCNTPVTYLFGTEIRVCGGSARYVRLGLYLPDYGLTGSCYGPCNPPYTPPPPHQNLPYPSCGSFCGCNCG